MLESEIAPLRRQILVEVDMNVTEQCTQPLEAITGQGAFFFRAYLKRYNLHPLTVSLASHVRYFTIWKMEQGMPIAPEDVSGVRAGLLTLTGIPFLAPLAVHASARGEQRSEMCHRYFYHAFLAGRD